MPYLKEMPTLKSCKCLNMAFFKTDNGCENFVSGKNYKYRLEYNMTTGAIIYRVYYEENTFVRFNLPRFTFKFKNLL